MLLNSEALLCTSPLRGPFVQPGSSVTQNVQASTILHREHKLISLWSLLRAGESCTRGNLLNLFNIYQTNATCKFKLLTKCFADTFTSNNHLWALVAYRSLCSSGPVISACIYCNKTRVTSSGRI